MSGRLRFGRQPADHDFGDPRVLERLRAAVGDLSWLLDRGYAPRAAQQLVGDRHQLDVRLRAAVARCSCGSDDRMRRLRHQVGRASLRGAALAVDTFNVLTTVQVALAGGLVLLGRDGCARDLASIYGAARDPEEQASAARHTGEVLEPLELAEVRWYIDRPVSHSASLGTMLEGLARERGWPWVVELVPSPDGVLARTGDVVATSDSAVLDRCAAWFNLTRAVVAACAPEAQVIDLSM